jgi:D-serine deaminase-like pyridoxal phosphate-dependent protein
VLGPFPIDAAPPRIRGTLLPRNDEALPGVTEPATSMPSPPSSSRDPAAAPPGTETAGPGSPGAGNQPTPGAAGLGGRLHLEEVETPVAVVDLDRVRTNLAKVMEYLEGHGLEWRPHVKTHKSRAVARLQLAAGASGLTVATPKEAETMASVCRNLLLAHPPVRPKARRFLALPDDVRLQAALDSAEALADLSAAATEVGREVDVLVEVDVGMRRVGVQDPSAAVALARRVEESPGVRFRGILFYPGHVRVPGREQGDPLALIARRVSETLEALTRSGHPPDVVSGGSSPTLWQSHRIPGLTEVRAGTCVFHDRDMWSLGVCGLEDVAYSILSTVVSTAVPGQAVVDAGSKALSKEEFRADGGGYGVLLDRPDVVVRGLSEEHGLLDLSGTGWRPSVGDRVRIIPNHVCVSVNLQDRLLALGPGGELDPLPLEARGRLPG